MTHVTQTQPIATRGFFGAIEALFAQTLRQIRERRDIRRTYNELSALSDRELNDLGIDRADIARVASGRVTDV